eukprot:Selendium_serpulae@DN6066_c0_g1_i1.p1
MAPCVCKNPFPLRALEPEVRLRMAVPQEVEPSKDGDFVDETPRKEEDTTTVPRNVSLGTKNMQYETAEPYIVTGPIIGKVTSTTARILIEVTHTMTVSCSLLRDDPGTTRDGEKKAVCVAFEAMRPKSFFFENLDPTTRYTVFFSVAPCRVINSSFTTLAPHADLLKKPVNLSFVSGNHPTTEILPVKGFEKHTEGRRVTHRTDARDASLFQALYRSVLARETDYLVHIGTNFSLGEYSDTDSVARKVMDALSWRSDPDAAYDECSDLIRQGLRDFLSEPFTKQTLANVPNIFCLTEDCLGVARKKSHLLGPLQKFVSKCALAVCNEYFRNLWEDYDPCELIGDIEERDIALHHFHEFGDFGIMFIDHLGHRFASGENQLLGETQWDHIELALDEFKGLYNEASMLMVVTSEPLVCLESQEGETSIFNTAGATEDRNRLISKLFQWKNATPSGNRDVVVVSASSVMDPVDSHNCTAVTDIITAAPCDSEFDKRIKQIKVGSASVRKGYSAGSWTAPNSSKTHYAFAGENWSAYGPMYDSNAKHAACGFTTVTLAGELGMADALKLKQLGRAATPRSSRDLTSVAAPADRSDARHRSTRSNASSKQQPTRGASDAPSDAGGGDAPLPSEQPLTAALRDSFEEIRESQEQLFPQKNVSQQLSETQTAPRYSVRTTALGPLRNWVAQKALGARDGLLPMQPWSGSERVKVPKHMTTMTAEEANHLSNNAYKRFRKAGQKVFGARSESDE